MLNIRACVRACAVYMGCAKAQRTNPIKLARNPMEYGRAKNAPESGQRAIECVCVFCVYVKFKRMQSLMMCVRDLLCSAAGMLVKRFQPSDTTTHV